MGCGFLSYGLWIKVHLSLCSNQNKKSFVPLSSIKFKVSAVATDTTFIQKPTTHYPQLTTQNAYVTKLSVNINKIATLRNSRGGNNPDLIKTALHIESFGADGITVHPRPDERHIRYDDVRELKKVLTTELNIEGNCREDKFVNLVLETKPAQVTLVPDTLGQLTSNHGWDTLLYANYLTEMIGVFKNAGIRTSIFCDPDPKIIEGAFKTGTDRIELYTESYAKEYHTSPEKAIAPYVEASKLAQSLGLGINAGHDLDMHNLACLIKYIPYINEVSIGHALICDALYLGLQNTVQLYKRHLTKFK